MLWFAGDRKRPFGKAALFRLVCPGPLPQVCLLPWRLSFAGCVTVLACPVSVPLPGLIPSLPQPAHIVARSRFCQLDMVCLMAISHKPWIVGQLLPAVYPAMKIFPFCSCNGTKSSPQLAGPAQTSPVTVSNCA